MFRIESYITPIILSHIDKYVKDFRPQDAQVSLWGGEVVFQNLDVRLDVLEEELQLPFNFVSGHIHELTVKVPWTKIASEPIQITINTIEFVLKLKSDSNVPTPKRKKSTKNDVDQPLSGYMASLVNKIANNISLKLHNIILKYVEEDIVVSMNIQLLSFDSADDNWKPAFIDISPTKVFLKKVISITDLTICLDKRNAMGKIDVCQEPILYRCSLQIRMLRKYNISSLHKSSLTRIDLFTENIELNISAQQYPMFIRLLVLAMALKERTANVRATDSVTEDEHDEEDGESMLLWAWNMLPSLFPVENEEDQDDQKGHYLHAGLYVNNFSVTIKSQEITTDNIVHSTKKIKYHPILRMAVSGIYADVVTLSNRWFSMKGGISFIGVYPLGMCTCGKKHNISTILTSADVPFGHKMFLDDSLQDPDSAENKGENRNYDFSWDSYYAQPLDETSMAKTPALSFDVVHYVDIPDDMSRSSILGSDLEYSNLSESFCVRCLVGPFNFKYCSSFIHIMDALKEYLDSYDYVPYGEDKCPISLNQLSPPSTEDYDALMSDIPLKVFQLKIVHPTVELIVEREESKVKIKNDKYLMPLLTLECQEIIAKYTQPYYPKRLVHTACQLPSPAQKLLDNSYNKLSCDVKKLSVNVVCGLAKHNVLHIPSADFTVNELVKPEFWQKITLPRLQGSVNVDKVILKFNKPQLILLRYLMNSFSTGNLSSNLFESSVLLDMHRKDLVILDLYLGRIHCSATKLEHTIGVTGSIQSFYGYTYTIKSMECMPEDQRFMAKSMILCTGNDVVDVVKFTCQLPIDLKNLVHPPMMKLCFHVIDVNFDPILFEFLDYQVEYLQRQETRAPKSPKRSFTSDKHPAASRKSINRPESVHSSSEPTATMTLVYKPKSEKHTEVSNVDLLSLINICRCLILQIELKELSLVVPDKPLTLLNPNSSLSSLQKKTPQINHIVFKLPTVIVKSSHVRNNTVDFEQKLPINIPDSVWNVDKDGFPWICSFSDLTCYTIQSNCKFELLTPLKSTISVALTRKLKDENLSVYDHSLAIHIDTEPMQFNFYDEQITFLMSSIGAVTKILSTTFCIDERTDLPVLEICERSTNTNYHSDLKEFFGTAKTKSDNSSDDTIQVEEEKLQSKLTTWIQWTLAKISLNFHSRKGEQSHKFSIEFEDIITSIDKQDIYVKIKTKVGFLTGICKTKSTSKDEWERNDLLGLTTISEGLRDNLDTFIEMTFTKAMISNVHTKWQTKKKENLNLNDSITEINVTMQRIDVKLDLQMLSTFMPIFGRLISTQPTEPMPTSVTSVTDLPLVYFKSKGMRIFVPIQASDQSNVLILKIDSISVNPTVDNPLIRKPVRCDIYSKAAQLRILNMPGSKVEDRQYEIVFNKISVGSGKWEEILRLMNPSESDSMYYENPAFDWNHKTEKPSIEVNAIFSNFNLAVQYAPCIVFKNVLVCGEAIEVNCLSDLIVDLTTDELLLFHNLQSNLMCLQESIPKLREPDTLPNTKQKIPKMTSKKSASRSKTFLKNERNMDHHLTDSGFESFERYSDLKYKKIKSRTSVTKTESKFVPFDVSFVGGKFNLNIFKVKKLKEPKEQHRNPLFSVTLFQPNMLIAQSALDKTIQLSLFDLSFKLGSDGAESEEKFPITVFDTHKGNLNVLGIPPSLFMYKEYTTPSGDKNLDIHIDRPMRIYLSPITLEQLLSVNSVLQTYIGQSDAQPCHLKSSSNKIQNIKSSLRDANRFNFSIAETDLDCSIPNEFSLKFYLSKMAVKLNIFDYPKRLTLDGYINSLVVSMDRFVIVNPLTINTICILTQEQWKKTPLLICKISSPCVECNIAPQNIAQAMKARDAFMDCLERVLTRKQEASSVVAHPVIDYSNLVSMRLPRLPSAANFSSEEHYQDDLRAGAFQFIDSDSDDTLPLPYQIQITSKAGGIICWRYPQPRTLHYIQIFPIPIYNPTNDNIKCRLEYYSEPHTAFLQYCEFNLSEKDVQELKLPNMKVSSETWRILIFQPFVSIDGQYFQEDNSSDDDETDDSPMLEKSLKVMGETLITRDINDYLNRDNQSDIYHLNPRALVGCMRIDSIFSPQSVPNVQLVADISHMSLTIKNNLKMSENSLKSVLGQYTAVGDVNDTHTVVKINSTRWNSHFCLYYDNKITLQTSFVFSTSVVDYSYLILQPLIEEVNLQFYYENADDIKVHVVADELRIRYGISVGHSLAVTEQIWRQLLTKDVPHNIFVMRYVICNCTSVPLHFGQHMTEESIYLKPNECCLYAFRTDKLEQQLAFSFGENKWCPSDPLHVGRGDVQYLKIDEGKMLIARSDKISASQRRIVIKGQIELLNMSEQSFVVAYKNAKNKDDVIECALGGKMCTSVVQRSNPEKDYCMNLKLQGKCGRGWSGDIPLHKTSKNIPWLVKVPTTTSQHHYSFWVRVQCEPLPDKDVKNFQNQRIFITIWPLFVCRSLMISNTTILDKSSEINYNLTGYGQTVELPMAAAYDTEHEIILNSKSPFTLSYKTIDPNSFFVIPEKLESIQASSADLEKIMEINWPCSREEELRWHRNLSGQEHPLPSFKCAPSRKLSCSLLLDLLPGCLFINSIGCDINLMNPAKSETCFIESNNVAVPFELLSSFSIEFQFDNDVTSSCHINLGSGRKSSSTSSYDLPDVGSVVLQLLTHNGICKFLLTSLNENGIRVIILSPLFVVYNLSTQQFSFWAFCVSTKDKHSVSVGNEKTKTHAVPCNDKANPGNSKGIGILNFTNLSHRRKDLNATHLFNFFLAIQSNNLEFSMPFLLNKTVSRVSFCINNGKRFIPLSLSINENQGQYFVCIHDDTSPAIEFENRTELNLLLAQCDPNDSMKTPVEHIKDSHFEWLQNVPSNATVFYTPPSINEHFPEKSDTEIAIFLACNNAQSLKPKWSAPIRIYKSDEFFLDLPTHGDVKIITNCRRKVVKIIIENINYKMEFNVKDIRTKLLHPSEEISNSRSQEKLEELFADDHVDTSLNAVDAFMSSTEAVVPQTSLKIDLFVKGFSITLYTDSEENNFVKTELIALYLDEITFFYTDKDRTMELGIRNFQIDNRLFSSGKFDFPVVLTAQNTYCQSVAAPSLFNIDELKSENSSMSVCHLKIVFFCDDFSPEEIYCKFQPIRAYVEDKYINFLLDFLVESHPSNLIYKQESAVEREFCRRGEVLIPKVVILQSIALSDPLRIRHVRIEPLSVLLSVHTCMRMYIALDHSPLDFAPFDRNEIFTLPVRFGYNLGMHYVSGAIFGAGWVVGSLEILGSPGGLARSVSTGLRDFVSMPVQGLLRGPWGFFVGITHGSASLLRNITAGTVNSVTKLAASVARNLDRLSLDDEHLQRTEALRRLRPQGITHGFAQGLTGLGISLLGAVGGIARHTLEATSSVGVVTGFGKGLVGAVTKPISGAAELVALTGQGMLHTVGFNQMPVARAVDEQKLDADEPSPEKIFAKLLPRLINTDQVLFLSFAALETVYGLKSIYIALTTSLVVLISMKKDEIVEVISIDRAYPLIDENDRTLVNLNVTSENVDESTELKCFQYGRVLQYIQDSTEDCAVLARTEMSKINFGAPKADHKISFFMDKHLAQHFVNYIRLLQNCKRKK